MKVKEEKKVIEEKVGYKVKGIKKLEKWWAEYNIWIATTFRSWIRYKKQSWALASCLYVAKAKYYIYQLPTT